VPAATGTTFIIGRHEFLIDPEDALGEGFILRQAVSERRQVKMLSMLICLFLVGQPQEKPAVPASAVAARPADVVSVDSILAAVYDVISGPADQKRDWDRMRSLFIPGARLIPVGPAQDGGFVARVLSAEDYITRSAAAMEKQGFFEREIARRTEKFGHIVHAFSTYESRRNEGDAQPFARGINSFQLMNDGKRWWVVTIFWEGERPGNPIPPEYLK
jgi:hypothetical protein